MTVGIHKRRALAYSAAFGGLGLLGWWILPTEGGGFDFLGLHLSSGWAVAWGAFFLGSCIFAVPQILWHLLSGKIWARVDELGVNLQPPIGLGRYVSWADVERIVMVDIPRGVRLQVTKGRGAHIPMYLLRLPLGTTREDVAERALGISWAELSSQRPADQRCCHPQRLAPITRPGVITSTSPSAHDRQICGVMGSTWSSLARGAGR